MMKPFSKDIKDKDLEGIFTLISGDIIASTATVHERSIGLQFKLMDDSVKTN